MTLEELAKKINRSETTLKTAFNRTKKNLEKYGIIISKSGYGKNASYSLTYMEVQNEDSVNSRN